MLWKVGDTVEAAVTYESRSTRHNLLSCMFVFDSWGETCNSMNAPFRVCAKNVWRGYNMANVKIHGSLRLLWACGLLVKPLCYAKEKKEQNGGSGYLWYSRGSYGSWWFLKLYWFRFQYNKWQCGFCPYKTVFPNIDASYVFICRGLKWSYRVVLPIHVKEMMELSC